MHNFRPGRGLALLLLFLLLFTGCASSEEEDILPQAGEQTETAPPEADTIPPEEQAPLSEETGGENFCLGYYVNQGLDPYTCDNRVNRALIDLLYEPLFSISPQFEAESCLAVSCRKTGTDLWTLTIREDVTFWDGEGLKAEDVSYSLTRACAAGSIFAQQLAPMEELEITGDFSLTFRWREERGDLTPLLEIPVIKADTARDAVPMGTGPYLPVLDDGDITEFYVNQNWWRGETVPVERIGLYSAIAGDGLIYGFDRGAVTLVATDLTDPDSLGYSGQYEAWDYPTSHLVYLGCNTADGPCTDSGLRQALLRAPDRETITRSLLSGHGIPTPLTFLPDSDCYDSELAALLEEGDTGALSEWQGEELTLLVNADSGFKTTIARFIAAGLNESGLSVTVRELSWNAYEEAVRAGEYDLYLGEVKLDHCFDPSVLVSEEGTLNYTAFSAPSMEAALSAYRQASAESRPEAAGALSLALAQEVPLIPLCFEEHSVLTGWGKVEELTATQSDLFYRFEQWRLSE